MLITLNGYSYCFNSPMMLVDLDGAWPSWGDINSGVKRLAKKGAKWYEKNKDDIWKLGATAVGVSAKITGENVVNNMCGGAVNGTVTAVGTVADIPGVGNFAGGFAGNLTADLLEKKDNVPDILKRAFVSGGVQSGMSMGGIVTKAGYDVGLKNLSAEGTILNYVSMVYSVGSGVTAYGFPKALKPCPE